MPEPGRVKVFWQGFFLQFFHKNLLITTFKRGVMNYTYASFYQNWIYPNLWVIVICVGIIAFFFSIWLSLWLSGSGG
jgi:hypothetical protein